MPENEVAPCALCLQVDELPSMLEVQLPPSQGEPGIRRRLCAGCVSAIEAAMSETERWGKGIPQDPIDSPWRRGMEERASKRARKQSLPPEKTNVTDGDQEAKVPETLE